MPDTFAASAAVDFAAPDPSAGANAVSARERALQATQLRLMQEMKKLDASAGVLRSRNTKLQEEVGQKEQQVQELTTRLEKAEDNIDELSHMVQMLQYQLSSGAPAAPATSPRGRHRPAVNLLQGFEAKRTLGPVLRPLGKQIRRIGADYISLKRFAHDRLFTMQLTLQTDGAALLQCLADFAARPTTLPAAAANSAARPPPPAPAFAAPRVRPRFPSFLIPEPIVETCTQPHLTAGAMAALEEVVGRLNLSVCRLSTVAGVPMDLVPAVAPSHNMLEQLSEVQSVLSRLQKRAEHTAGQLALGQARRHHARGAAALQRLEEREEEVSHRVAKCTELLLQANGVSDPTTKSELLAAFGDAEKSIETRHTEFQAPGKVDKGCQCTISPNPSGSGNSGVGKLDVRAGASGGVAQGVQGPTPAPAADPAPKRPALRRTVPFPAPAPAPAPSPFQRMVENIEKLLALAPEGSRFRLELEMELREAKDLLANDPSQRPPPPAYQTCPDDERAVQAFKQWQLKRRVQRSKQQFIIESFFRSLKGWYNGEGTLDPEEQAPPSPTPRRSNNHENFGMASPRNSESPLSPSLKPGGAVRPLPERESTGITDFVAVALPASPCRRSPCRAAPNTRLQPLAPSLSGLPTGLDSVADSPISWVGELSPSVAVRRMADGAVRRRVDAACGARPYPADESPEPPMAPALSPSTSALNGSFRLTPLRSPSMQ